MVTPVTVLASYVIGVLVTVLAAAIPAWRTRRISPVQALGDTVAMPESSMLRRFIGGMVLLVGGVALMALGLLGDVPRAGWITLAGAVAVLLGASIASPVLGRPLLDGVRRSFTVLFGTVGRLAGENTRRNPRRTTSTASALMIGLALAGAVAILANSGKATTAVVIEDSFAGDFVIGNVSNQPFSSAVADRVAEVDGVTQVMRQRYGVGSLDGDFGLLGGIDPDGLGSVVKVDLIEGDLADLADGSVVIDSSFADSRDLHPGDQVTYTFAQGEVSFDVAAIIEPAPLLVLPATTIATLADAGFPQEDATVFVAGPTADIDTLEQAVGGNPLLTVNDRAGLVQQQNDQANQGLLMIYGLLALALIIAVLGIVNTLALSIIERTREIGLLRAIGMSPPAAAETGHARVGGHVAPGHRDGPRARPLLRPRGVEGVRGGRADRAGHPRRAAGAVRRRRGGRRRARGRLPGSPGREARRPAGHRHGVSLVTGCWGSLRGRREKVKGSRIPRTRTPAHAYSLGRGRCADFARTRAQACPGARVRPLPGRRAPAR